MTTVELAEYTMLKNAIAALEARKEALIISATSATRELKEASSGGTGTVSDIVGNSGAKIADIERMITQKKWEMEARLERIVEYVSGVSDAIVFTAMTLHYIDGLTWNEAAHRLNNTADSIRMAVSRYVDAHP